MVDIEDNPVTRAGSGAASAMSKRLGPLPIWGWAVAILGGVGAASYLHKRNGATATPLAAAIPSPFQSSPPINTGAGSTVAPGFAPLSTPSPAAPDDSGIAGTITDRLNGIMAQVRDAIAQAVPKAPAAPPPAGIPVGGSPGVAAAQPVAPATATRNVAPVYTASQLASGSGLVAAPASEAAKAIGQAGGWTLPGVAGAFGYNPGGE